MAAAWLATIRARARVDAFSEPTTSRRDLVTPLSQVLSHILQVSRLREPRRDISRHHSQHPHHGVLHVRGRVATSRRTRKHAMQMLST